MVTGTTAAAQGDSRDTSLGYLRAFTVLLVVAHHVATAYAAVMPGPAHAFPGQALDRIWGAFPIVGRQGSPVFAILLGLDDTFFMSLLFLLSGVFVCRSVDRRGIEGFARSRIVRLGIPFVLGALLLAPLAYLPAFLQITRGGGLGDFVARWFGTPNLTAGPMWFLWLLLAFDLVAALLFLVWKGWAGGLGRILPDGARRPGLYFLTLLLLSMAAYIPLAAAFGSSHWTLLGAFDVQTSRLVHYALYFTVGVALGAADPQRSLLSPAGGLARGWWAWLLVSSIAVVFAGADVAVVATAKGLTPPVREAIGGVAFALVCASLCFLFLAVFLRFVRRANPVMDSLQANAYGIFIMHYAFVNWLNYALLGADVAVGGKFAIAFLGAAGLSWLTAALLRRLVGPAASSRGVRQVAAAAS